VLFEEAASSPVSVDANRDGGDPFTFYLEDEDRNEVVKYFIRHFAIMF
jgi:hypothetical protein